MTAEVMVIAFCFGSSSSFFILFTKLCSSQTWIEIHVRVFGLLCVFSFAACFGKALSCELVLFFFSCVITSGIDYYTCRKIFELVRVYFVYGVHICLISYFILWYIAHAAFCNS
jgi:hypothetical protein